MGRLVFLCALLLLPAAARAAEGGGGGSETVFIVQIVLLIALGRGLGEAMVRIGQPPVVGQLLAGILLGSSVFGALWPAGHAAVFPDAGTQKAMTDAIGQFGVLMLLLLTGMETDLKLARRVGRAAIAVSLAGVALPLACGIAAGMVLPGSLLPDPGKRFVGALFLGTALAISSVKIVAMVVRDMNFMRRNIGQIIVASAIIEDTIGWIVIAVILGIATQGGLSVAGLAQSVVGTLAFLGLSLTLGRRLVYRAIRFANDVLASEFAVVSTVIVIMGVMALITTAIGVHSVLGAFVAGVLVGESPILKDRIDEQIRGIVTGLFMPVFFGLAGLSTDLTILKDPHLLALAAGLVAIASLGKFGGAFAGARAGGLTTAEALALGCAMNARGSTEVIVATIGLSMGVLSRDLFTMIVAMAVLTTMAMPPMLRWALRRLPMDPAERRRLEREELDRKGYVSRLERLLVAVDDSDNGHFASRLAGLVAGVRGLPVTALRIGRPQPAASSAARAPEEKRKSQGFEVAIRSAAADAAASMASQSEDQAPAPVDVVVRAEEELEVAHEAVKGYDLLWIGLDRPLDAERRFGAPVSRIAARVNGALAVVVAQGEHRSHPHVSALSILVPVTGTEVSRRALEIACVLARVAQAPLTALFVAAPPRGRSKAKRASREETAVLEDAARVAARYGVALDQAIRAGAAPEDMILEEAAKRGHDLIVMGVGRRPGKTLYFGTTAATVLAKAPQSLLFVSTEGSPDAEPPEPAAEKEPRGK